MVSSEGGKNEHNKPYIAMEEKEDLRFVRLYSSDVIYEYLANCILGSDQIEEKKLMGAHETTLP